MKFEKSFQSLAHLNPCHLFGWLHFFSRFEKHQSLVLELKEKNIISKVLNDFFIVEIDLWVAKRRRRNLHTIDEVSKAKQEFAERWSSSLEVVVKVKDAETQFLHKSSQQRFVAEESEIEE